tara:strand:- start:3001 stop:3240 length:240 start_codon:yes stop_codon:yes gene_type:complete
MAQSPFANVVDRLLETGRLAVDMAGNIDAPQGVQAWAEHDGKFTLVADQIAPEDAMPLLLHDAFHSGARPLLGMQHGPS